MSPTAVSFVLLGVLAVAFGLGATARSQMGIEFDPESVRSYVNGLGLVAPAIYVVLVTFRNFLLLPSMVVLTAGGLVFGAAIGTALGGLGILVSGLIQFSLARGIGRDWLQRNLGASYQRFEQRVQAAGLLMIGVSTAHPFGPMTPFHYGAGFSSIALVPFLLAIAVGGLCRAFAYSFFGANLLEPGSEGFWVSSSVLLLVAVVPLMHPTVRARILGQRAAGSSGPASQ